MENKYDSISQDSKKQLNGKAPLATDTFKKLASPVLESHLVDDLTERFESAKKATTEVYDNSIDQVKQNPLVSLAAAAGIGVLAGFLMGRRK
jgi:ElaB/YqjD/DUF883 family membrane-anchored ribosome-binding protein